MASSEFLKKLKALTPNLPPTPFESMVFTKEAECFVQVEQGNLKLHPLYKSDPEAAVCLVDADPETIMGWHTHAEKEIFIVFSGALKIKLEDKDVCLGRGDIYYIMPNVKHLAYWTEESRVLSITIPASKGFPDVSSN